MGTSVALLWIWLCLLFFFLTTLFLTLMSFPLEVNIHIIRDWQPQSYFTAAVRSIIFIQTASYLAANNQTKSGSQHGSCWRLDNREIKPQTNHILLILVVSYFKNKNSRESIRTDSYQALYIVTKRKHLEILL